MPIFRSKPQAAASDAELARAQFPLTLPWALTHWKAQGMTIERVRICMRERAAGVPGVGYVAVSRVSSAHAARNADE